MDEETYKQAMELLDKIREAIYEAETAIEINKLLKEQATTNKRSKIMVAKDE